MKNLSNNYIDQVYYVKSGVIFKILPYDDGDACAVKASDVKDKLPKITVKKGSEEAKPLYLDVYIEDGDTYADNAFKKTVHGEEDSSSAFTDYYKALCEKEMESGILANFREDYDWFKENLDALRIPTYMIAGQGYTVTGVTQFNFTENFLNEKKDKVVQEEVQKAAEDRANIFGYTVDGDVVVKKK